MTPPNDERLLILNLLRDGKISTEDAEKLLRAVSTPEDDPKRARAKSSSWGVEDVFGKPTWDFDSSQISKWAEQFASTMKDVGKQVEKTLKDVFKNAEHSCGTAASPEESGIEIAENADVRIAHKGGPATVGASESGRLEIRVPRRHVHVGEGQVEVEGFGGTLDVRLPAGAHHVSIEVTGGSLSVNGIAAASLSARTLGGSMTLSNVEAPLELHTVGGSLHLTDARASSIEAETMGGGVTARLGTVTDGIFAFSAAGGGITLELGAESRFRVVYDASGGIFDSQWEGARLNEREVQVGEGGARIELKTQGGTIALWRTS